MKLEDFDSKYHIINDSSGREYLIRVFEVLDDRVKIKSARFPSKTYLDLYDYGGISYPYSIISKWKLITSFDEIPEELLV